MKKLIKRLRMLLVIGLVVFGIRAIYLNSYPSWPIEKKQSYQFMLLERKLLSNPEKCEKILVVIEKTDWRSDSVHGYPHILGVESDTITPLEIKKIVSYPKGFGITITVPFEQLGKNSRLALTKYDGKINAWILSPSDSSETINKSQGLFFFGIVGGDVFEMVPKGQTLQALKQANKIVESI